MFSGIGGFEYGIQRALGSTQTRNKRMGAISETRGNDQPKSGGEQPQRGICIGYSEIDKYAAEIYQRHFPNHKNYGDITTIDEKELPDFDLLVGGFPCQAFSIAGKRGGFDDTRGTMFFELARILREKQPRLFVFENVKGLLSHDQGRTFTTIIATLDELGYDCQWQVLNSKNHGVPQNRERVFIIGHLRGTSRPEVFPFGGTNGETNVVSDKNQLLKWSKSRGMDNGKRRDEERLLKSGTSQTLSTGEGCGNFSSKNYIQQLNQPKHSNDRVYGTDGVSPTLNTMQGGNRQPFIPEDSRIRRLTPTECERLQGFPDGWTEGVSDTQRYKTLGNAVTVNVIKDVFSRIMV